MAKCTATIPGTDVQTVGLVTDEASLDKLMKEVAKAQPILGEMTQEQVDRMFQACAVEAGKNRVLLAQMTVDESGLGVMEDKVIKNHFASEIVYNAYKDTKTCGVIEYSAMDGFARYAEPVGVLAAAVPCTNPTSTAIFKCLLAIKTRNCIVISPHPRTARCTIEAARIIRDVAIKHGAPEYCIGWINTPTPDLCSTLMKHPVVQMIVATGAGGLVKAAYSSGKPAMGGGSGNTPVIIDETADIPMAVNCVLLSKTFDNGMICASEQSLVVHKNVADQVRRELAFRGAHFVTGEAKKRLGDLILGDNGVLNPPAVGQSAEKLCELAGIKDAPKGVRLLIAELNSVGGAEKLSHEKLCPCVGFFVVDDFPEALDRASELVHYGGLGHTSVLYTNLAGPRKQERISQFQSRMPTGRTLVCMPASQGAIGGVFNYRQHPSMTLGCGTWGNNGTAESLQVKHLLNVKEICERRALPHAFFYPEKVEGSNAFETVIKKVDGPVAIISDVHAADVAAQAAQHLRVASSTIIKDECSIEKAKEIAASLTSDSTILAVGGSSVVSAAKLARIFSVCSSSNAADLELRSFDLSTKMTHVNQSSHRLICVPAGSTGCEMAPYVIVRDGENLRLISDRLLCADTVVLDDTYMKAVQPSQMCTGAFVGLLNALDAHVTLNASQLTHTYSSRAITALVKGLLAEGSPDVVALQQACIASGIAVGNAGIGLITSIYVALGPLNVPREVCAASAVRQVIYFNAEETPSKMGTSAHYSRPVSRKYYDNVAEELGVKDIEGLCGVIESIAKKLGFATSLKEYGVSKELFDKHLDEMALRAFDSQGAMLSPRYPLLREMKLLLQNAYEGKVGPIKLGDC